MFFGPRVIADSVTETTLCEAGYVLPLIPEENPEKNLPEENQTQDLLEEDYNSNTVNSIVNESRSKICVVDNLTESLRESLDKKYIWFF